MLVVGIAAACVLANVVLVLAFLRVMRGMQRQHARERDALIDRICHLAGRPWNEAPRREEPESLPDWANTWEASTPEQMVA